MFYFYLVASAALIPLLNIPLDILREPYSWWLVPLLFVAFLLGFIILHALTLIIAVAVVDMKKPAEQHSRFYRSLFNSCLGPALWAMRVHIHSKGAEKIPENTRFLLVCNHLSDFDPLIAMQVLPDAGLGFIAKKDIYEKRKFVAGMMHKLFCVPIDRENNREAAKAIINAVNIIKEDKASIGIFPEGYTSKDGELQPFRNGAFKIAYRAGVPVVVATIVNTKEMMKNLFRRRTDVYFNIIDVIPAERLKELNTTELGDIVFAEIAEEEKRLLNQKTAH